MFWASKEEGFVSSDLTLNNDFIKHTGTYNLLKMFVNFIKSLL